MLIERTQAAAPAIRNSSGTIGWLSAGAVREVVASCLVNLSMENLSKENLNMETELVEILVASKSSETLVPAAAAGEVQGC
jgi:hypothetical protein